MDTLFYLKKNIFKGIKVKFSQRISFAYDGIKLQNQHLMISTPGFIINYIKNLG